MEYQKEELTEEQKKEKTLRLSIKEGAAASVMGGTGEAYIVPFALALNANNLQIGFLSSFVNLFGSLAQISGSKAMYNFKRKTLILISILTQATMWLLILSLGFLFYKGYIDGFSASVLIVLYVIYSFSGNFGSPSWFSMMGDIVSNKKRGKYFSKRNKITGFVVISITLLSALLLDYYKNKNIVLLGFIILFFTASIARYFSGFLISKHYDPPHKIKKDSYFGFWQFVKKAPSNNFGRFVIYVSLINLATNFAGPFFAVYMLNELKFNYILFTIVNISSAIFTILVMNFWGEIGDNYGNRILLKIGSIIIPFIPVLWIFSANPIYLIFSTQLLSGVGWAAFNLSSSNFIYDTVTPERRGLCIAYFNIFNGVGMFIGAMLGGFFAYYVHVSFMNPFLLIFLISGILRALIVIIMLPKIKEVREIPNEEIKTLKVISNLTNFIGKFSGKINSDS